MSPIRMIVVAFFTLSCISCREATKSNIEEQDRLFKQDAPQVLQEIKEMLYKDQSIRWLWDFGTSDTFVVDSIRSAYAARGISIDSILLENNSFLVSAAFRDSISRLLHFQDEKHTRRMVELISKYGYPSSNRVDSLLKIDPFLILHHPSFKYKDTILALLQLELQAKRLDTVSYEMVKWDYNGRKGLPNIPLDVKDNGDGTKTITLK